MRTFLDVEKGGKWFLFMFRKMEGLTSSAVTVLETGILVLRRVFIFQISLKFFSSVLKKGFLGALGHH